MELWTPQHAQTLLPALGIMIVIAIILRLTIGKKDLKIRMIPFQILACILFAIEIGKQIVSFEGGYDLYHIPLHFCSLFIFALPLMAFYRGKHQNTVFEIVSVLCTSMTLLMLIYPALIYGSWNIENYFVGYLDFHTVTFHNIVMFEMILILALDLHQPEKKMHIKPLMVVITIFCVVSASMAQILKTNFANYYQCNIAPLEAVRVSLQGVLGYGLTQFIYVTIVSVLTLAFVLMCAGLYKLLRKLLPSKQPAAV
ncbi:MAG: YwaF family protein [Oscillospiraceae bacterium]|nr:YwaF family protein [Oscillospiraceae bacterium]